MRGRFIVALIAATTLLLGLVAAPAHAATGASSQKDHAQQVADLVDRHNAIRKSNGLTPLKFAPTIAQQISQPWSMQMANSNNLSHNSNFGWSGANRWAENVAYTSNDEDTVHLMQMWMDSAGHRKNILNPAYTVISVGLVRKNGLSWATANFYAGSLRTPGTLYASGASWLSASGSNGSGSTGSPLDVYTTPGTHHVNGRDWRTSCAPYSQTKRCTTEIWATQVSHNKGRYVSTNGWVFNNLTYLPSARSLWKTNNLGRDASWSANGRNWRTECDTAATGRNGCRSYIWTSVVVSTPTSAGYRYSLKNQWVFNNTVKFS
ncbi:CAP domain-containing protein [Tessaracoccus antarcticus]|uniref:CAP domain-containing protein n=1 Tax=Tessaracoccus antarcticus TaxID=2479848 RepID=A0A3M0GB51_9ACTN|nr:CAP domain-containing protein [Tessaracoccus antarcticus]RMB62191.1 CAP domain-containing protein [Tessaracoccus antarcticus]